jgi:drug/metabolite transporter (DMT)-like permease
MVILLALTAAVLYGSGDFLGGTASRGAHVLSVLLLASPAGAVVVLIAALVSGQPVNTGGLAWGAAAGAVGGTGLVIFFAGLAAGPMNVVAPVSGLVSTILPVGVALADGERPHALVYAGAAACLVAIVLASAGPGEAASEGRQAGQRGAGDHGAGDHGAGDHGAGDHGAGDHGAGGPAAGQLGRARAVGCGVLSGAAFGAFFLFLHDGTGGTGSGALWPIVAARLVEVVVVAIAAVAVRPGRLPSSAGAAGSAGRAGRAGWAGWAGWAGRINSRLALAAAGSGAIDAIANICYVAAARAGMLGLAVLLTSLYPGVTVLLARLVLGERLRPVQQAGLGLAALGIVLVAV